MCSARQQGQDLGTDLGPQSAASWVTQLRGSGKGGRQVPIPMSPCCPEWCDRYCPSMAPMPATHGDARRVSAQSSEVSGGQMGWTWDHRGGRGLRKSPLVYHRGVTGEVHTCLMEEAGGVRCDGARVREASHLGYVPEQANAVNGRHIKNGAWNRNSER